jgi:formate hydrogenlyase subunit 3/multisubunit Na+/H+ antiporter MnhD subunit
MNIGFIYLLPLCRPFLENLIAILLVSKFLKILSLTHKRPQMDHILSQPNPIRRFSISFHYINFNAIFQFTPTFTSLLSSVFCDYYFANERRFDC